MFMEEMALGSISNIFPAGQVVCPWILWHSLKCSTPPRLLTRSWMFRLQILPFRHLKECFWLRIQDLCKEVGHDLPVHNDWFVRNEAPLYQRVLRVKVVFVSSSVYFAGSKYVPPHLRGQSGNPNFGDFLLFGKPLGFIIKVVTFLFFLFRAQS